MHVVTGAGSGIGRGVALALAGRGLPVIAVGRTEETLVEVASAGGSSVRPIVADVTGAVDRDRLALALGGEPVDSVVHGAASVVQPRAWRSLDPDDLVDHFRVHVAAPIAVARALLERGPVHRMAFVDSYAATTPRLGWSAYALIKAAAQMSARAAAGELRETAVIRIFPGAVDTPLLRSILEDPAGSPATCFYRALAAKGGVGDPMDIGRQIASILVDEPIEALRSQEVWHVGHPA